MNGSENKLGGPPVDPELLDRYADAIQTRDASEADRLLHACPDLHAWTACLQALDALASTIGPAESATSPDQVSGMAFGPFVIRDVIGRGGMGVVYRAWHQGLARDVAIKLLAAGAFASDEEQRRFLAEARLAARVRHPSIVTIYDAGEHAGHLYIAMDLVNGDDLAARIRRGPMEPRDAATIMASVVRGVGLLHDSGILHRDIKPSNVLLSVDGVPKLADFGLARDQATDDDMTATGTILGTPEYMAPEQAAGRVRSLGVRSDVYSLGAVLYALLTGRPPFVGESKLLVVMSVIEREPVPPRRLNRRVPRALQRICLRAMEKEPSRRYPTAVAMAEDLEAWLRGDRIAPFGTSPVHRLGRGLRRYPAAGFRLIGLVGTMIVIMVRCLIDPTTIAFYRPVFMGLLLWAIAASFLEWLSLRRLTLRQAGSTFVVTDAAFVTTLLVLVEGAESPLVAVHPVLVAAAGLWLDRRLVQVAAVASLLGYALLLASSRYGFQWNVAAIVTILILCAAAIAEFQVGRLRRG